jgi:hypothetical protein
VGLLAQLLLDALYTSTCAETPSPVVHVSTNQIMVLFKRQSKLNPNTKKQTVRQSDTVSPSKEKHTITRNSTFETKPETPPAKNTSPDGSDAAAKYPRACLRPVGWLAQLLLDAMYTSTRAEYAPTIRKI